VVGDGDVVAFVDSAGGKVQRNYRSLKRMLVGWGDVAGGVGIFLIQKLVTAYGSGHR
jgi:hypothetical protein